MESLRFSVVLTAALAANLLPSVWAQGEAPTGWYVGIEGMSNSVEDAENTSTVLTTTTTTGPAGCAIPAVIPGLPCLVPTPGMTVTTTAGSQQVSEVRYKNALAGGFTIGYRGGKGWRPEFNLSHRSNDIESIFLKEGFPAAVNGSTITNVDGFIESTAGLLSAWYDLPTTDKLQPYLGGGIGYRHIKFSGAGGNNGGDDEDDSFAFQIGAGLSYPISTRSLLTLDYRYLGGQNADLKSDQNTRLEAEYRNQSIGLGLRYFLSAPPVLDADGDGTPDAQDKCPDTPPNIAVGPDGCPLDSDGDGVPDYLDKCPDTPAGVKVKADGCPSDSDGDGTPDEQDKCPDTPAGIAVGPDGCPLDSDGDGVTDDKDKCPNTPAGIGVDLNGCPPDSDGDGIPDFLDKCADTPAGMKVGPDGCPLDSDGDGVPDYLDECPNSPAGAKVLANGCALKGDCRTPRPGEQVDAKGCALDQAFILKGVNFEFDSDRLTPEAQLILNQVAETLKAYPDVKVEIAGHTDNLGTDTYNLGLSEKRSISVKNYLSGRGVDAARMTPNGYGESQPIADNANEEGQSQNRRVELRVIED